LTELNKKDSFFRKHVYIKKLEIYIRTNNTVLYTSEKGKEMSCIVKSTRLIKQCGTCSEHALVCCGDGSAWGVRENKISRSAADGSKQAAS
jgi:hypothetical protein